MNRDYSRKIISSIQILRGLAALFVVFRHAAKEVSANSSEAFAIGQAGVDVFFVISGFVIYMTGRNAEWHVFLRRRGARIIPLYWIVITLSVAVIFYNHGARDYFISNTILSYLFIPAYLGPSQIFPPIVVGWSLNFEAYFYLIFTFALVFFPRSILIVVSAIICGGILIGPGGLGLLVPEQFAPAVLLLPISLEFVAGMWLAELWTRDRVGPFWMAAVLLPIAVLWFALAPSAGAYTVLRPLYWGVPAILLVWAGLQLERSFDFSRFRLLLLVGNASYALYLVHLFVLPVTKHVMDLVDPGMPVAVTYVTMVVGSLIAGIMIHYLVELPLLKQTSAWMGLKKSRSHIGAESLLVSDTNARTGQDR